MITNISLKNFRGFEDEISVRIRPITVLIGRNSAGKSSLVKFLQMLRQTLESERDEFFVADGPYVQMGHWTDLKNSKSQNSFFEFKIEIATSDIPPPAVQQLWKALGKRGVVTETGQKVQFSMDLDASPVSRVSPVANFTVSGKIKYAKNFKTGRHAVRGTIDNTEIFFKESKNVKSTTFLKFSRSTDSLNDLFQLIAAEQFLDRLRYEFTSIKHLSPVREESLHTVQSGNPPPRDVGDRGEFAMPHLSQIFNDHSSDDKMEFIQRFAFSVAEVIKISAQRQISNPSTQINAVNYNTSAKTYLTDFGFGVSQCLPIFIQGVMQDPQQLFIVEQPEAQLHPTAQLELGTFFVDLWVERQVPTIIETHSANLLLRIRKLVKERRLNPEHLSIAFFTIEDNKVVVKNLDVYKDGSMEKGLPMEFFGADVIEAIKMGA